MDLNYFKIVHLMNDMRRELHPRQRAIDSRADSETPETITVELHRKLDMAKLLLLECSRVTIQLPLQRAFLITFWKQLRDYIAQLKNVLVDTGMEMPTYDNDAYLQLPGSVVREKIMNFLSHPQDLLNVLQPFGMMQLRDYIAQLKNALRDKGLQMPTYDAYLQLPGSVVREKIMSFLSHPQDLLNLLQAYPNDEQYALYTIAQLEFELAFPEMIASGTLSWDDDQKLRQFSSTSDHHRKVILHHFEHFLANDDLSRNFNKYGVVNSQYLYPSRYDSLITMQDVIKSMEGVALKEWNKFPVTSQVDIDVSGEYNPQHMEMGGKSVWDAKMCILRETDGLEVDWRKLCGCLVEFPNLRNLHLWLGYNDLGFDWNVEHFEGFRAIHLPELPHLKSLKLSETRFNNTESFLILRRLLEKYGEQLNQLVYTVSHPHTTQFPVDFPPCANLTLLSYIDQSTFRPCGRTWRSSIVAVQFMSNFRNARLKKIRLSLNDSSPLRTMYQWLVYLSRTFGNSLELLKFEFGLGTLDGMTMEAPSLASLDVLQFPKLIHFGTNLKSTRDLYKAILRFSVLETLEVGRDRCHQLPKYKNMFYLDGDNLKSCGIWEELPTLKWIRYWDTEVKITREEVRDQN